MTWLIATNITLILFAIILSVYLFYDDKLLFAGTMLGIGSFGIVLTIVWHLYSIINKSMSMLDKLK